MQPAAKQTERHADIAATVVATMRQLGVLGLPRNYEIFYEALSGTNRELSLAVVSLSNRPTQDDLDRIGRRFFAQNHGPGIVEHARDVIARELEDIATLLRSERTHIEKYGRILDETSSGHGNRSLLSRELLQKSASAMSDWRPSRGGTRPDARSSSMSCQRFVCREPGALVCASSSTRTRPGRRASAASRSSSSSRTPLCSVFRRGKSSRPSRSAPVS